MPSPRRHASAFAFLVFLTACSTRSATSDAMTFPDAGSGQDAGATSDGGSQTGDAGPTVFRTYGIPQNAPDLFSGADDPSNAITLAYPSDGVMLPPNLRTLELQFTPTAHQTLFEISFEADGFPPVRVYTDCNPLEQGCSYQTSDEVWQELADRREKPIRWRVRGADDSGGSLGTSETRVIDLTDDELKGGVYYWNRSLTVIRRVDFGRGRMPEPTTYLGTATSTTTTPDPGGNCIGCHALSRDGSRIVAPTLDGTGVYNVADKSEITTLSDHPFFPTFSPDGTKLMAATDPSGGSDDHVLLYDLASSIEPTDLGAGTMPDWSPNGQHVVYVSGNTDTFIGVLGGSLETMVHGDSGFGSGPELLASTGENNYYPTYSPDGAWVLFDRSPSGHTSYAAPDAELWTVSADGGDPIFLHAADADGAETWPKWDESPYQFHGHTVFWFTFSSERPMGLRAGGTMQIWIAGFDPAAAAAGRDPSRPAFLLPFQDRDSANYIGQWVTEIRYQPCNPDGTCSSEFDVCREDLCVPAE